MKKEHHMDEEDEEKTYLLKNPHIFRVSLVDDPAVPKAKYKVIKRNLTDDELEEAIDIAYMEKNLEDALNNFMQRMEEKLESLNKEPEKSDNDEEDSEESEEVNDEMIVDEEVLSMLNDIASTSEQLHELGAIDLEEHGETLEQVNSIIGELTE